MLYWIRRRVVAGNVERSGRDAEAEVQMMALTLSEAAEAKRISRNGMWLAVCRNAVTARKTSGGMWLIEEDEKWEQYHPQRYEDHRGEERVPRQRRR